MTIVVGRYAIRRVDERSVWIAVREGENAGEGGSFRLADLNGAVFPEGGRDLFAEYRGQDEALPWHGAIDRFYRENF